MPGQNYDKAVVLHIGAPKTGTKYVQNFLLSNKQELERRLGLLYPGAAIYHDRFASYLSGSTPGHASNLVADLTDSGEIRAKDTAFMKALHEEIEQSPADRILLSYEGLFHDRRPVIEKIRDYLDDAFANVRIVAYVRDPISWALSAFSTNARLGFGQGLKPHQRLNAKAVLSAYVDVFGKERMAVRGYGKEFWDNECLISDFLVSIGIEKAALSDLPVPSERINRSLSALAIEMLKEIRTSLPEPLEPHEWNVTFDRLAVTIPGPKLRLQGEIRKKILEDSAEDFAYLREEFGIDLERPSGAQRPAPDDRIPGVTALLREAIRTASDQTATAYQSAIDQLNDRLDRTREELRDKVAECQGIAANLARVRAERDASEEALKEIHSSRAWKVALALQKAKRWLTPFR